MNVFGTFPAGPLSHIQTIIFGMHLIGKTHAPPRPASPSATPCISPCAGRWQKARCPHSSRSLFPSSVGPPATPCTPGIRSSVGTIDVGRAPHFWHLRRAVAAPSGVLQPRSAASRRSGKLAFPPHSHCATIHSQARSVSPVSKGAVVGNGGVGSGTGGALATTLRQRALSVR